MIYMAKREYRHGKTDRYFLSFAPCKYRTGNMASFRISWLQYLAELGQSRTVKPFRPWLENLKLTLSEHKQKRRRFLPGVLADYLLPVTTDLLGH
jgi:hypothetical protein